MNIQFAAKVIKIILWRTACCTFFSRAYARMLKIRTFSFFIFLFISSTSQTRASNQLNSKNGLAQIFGGTPVQSWNPLAHKVVLVRSVVDETKTDSPEGTRINQTRKNCTGVMIRPRIVLTAAHCFDPQALRHEVIFSIQPDQLTASENALLDTTEEKKIRTSVIGKASITDLTTGASVDLALLKISTPAPFPYLPVTMTSQSEVNRTELSVRLTGYGRSENPKNPDRRLRSVETTTQPFGRDDAEIIVDQRSGRGICNGDSGGPVFVYDRGEFKVIGVNSYVFNDGSETGLTDVCQSFGAAVHLGPYRSQIQQAIEALEKTP